jgi:2-dehydropantoate 2-reductase
VKTILVGTGAIGGTVAVLAKANGFDLHVVCRGEETAEKIKNDGLYLKGPRGEHKVKLHAYPDIESIDQHDYDICIIASKAYAMPEIAKAMLPHIKEDALVVSMQNGMCLEILADIVGKERAVGCMIGFGANLDTPTSLTMTSLGSFAIGMLPGYTSDKLEYIRKMLDCTVPCHISDMIQSEQYSKLIINSCITSLGALTGQTLGVMLDEKSARVLFLAIAREGIKVAKAMNLYVPPFNKVLNYNLLLLTDAKWFDLLCETLFRVIGKVKYKDDKSSSLQSLERGKPTEIDYFNGYIVRKGKEFGVPTPVNEKMVQLIKEIERKERKISMDNLKVFVDEGLIKI